LDPLHLPVRLVVVIDQQHRYQQIATEHPIDNLRDLLVIATYLYGH
jgi:hypothetical protein